MNDLAELIQLVVGTFPEDPSAPSVVFSYIKAKESWYISIVRYKEKFGKDKYVVSSFMNGDLDFTVSHMLKSFKESYATAS